MRRSAVLAAMLLGLCAARPASAQSADALFSEGLKLFDAGKVHEACDRFEASFRIDPALGTLQNLATCHEADGRLARAYTEYLDLETRAAKAGFGHKAREVMGRTKAAALAKKVGRVELRLGSSPNVDEILVDDAPVDRAAWQAPVVLDPGAHTFTFRAAGRRAATQSVTVAAGASPVPVDVPVLAAVPVAAPPPPPPRVPLRTVALGVGGVGVAGILLGSVFGGLTFARKGAAASHCTGMYCDPEGLSLQDSAHGFAAASTGAFVVGLAAAGAGAFLFVWSRRDARRSVTVSPAVGSSSGGVQASGSW